MKILIKKIIMKMIKKQILFSKFYDFPEKLNENRSNFDFQR